MNNGPDSVLLSPEKCCLLLPLGRASPPMKALHFDGTLFRFASRQHWPLLIINIYMDAFEMRATAAQTTSTLINYVKHAALLIP